MGEDIIIILKGITRRFFSWRCWRSIKFDC